MGEKTVFMPRCSSAQRSVASACGEKCKQVVSGVRGVCDDVTCPFLHSGVVQVLKAVQVDTRAARLIVKRSRSRFKYPHDLISE